MPACRTLDCVTVFARELALARRTAELLAGDDGFDPLARRAPEVAARTVDAVPARPRVAIPTARHLTGLAPGWAEAFHAAAARLAASGVEVVEVDIEPLLDAAALLYDGAFVAERYAAVGSAIEAHPDLIGTQLDASVASIVLGGASRTAAEVFDDRERLDRLAALSRAALDGCDALLTPTTTWHPTIAEVAADPIGANSRMGRFTNFANLLDLCVARRSPPARWTGCRSGSCSPRLRSTTGPSHALAELLLAPAVDLLVVGAHLTGQPLNAQLVSAGGSFSAAVTTTPDYRLFALDTTPAKPGMLRVASGGASIAGEVWTLPAAGFARFVAALPAPMTIGRVTLTDGRSVSGFLCEPVAVEEGVDITAYGGWRAWLAAASPVRESVTQSMA